MLGFILALGSAGFTIFLLGWAGYNTESSGWVYGFLPVFWSLLMMLRLMTLTDRPMNTEHESGLAGLILRLFHDRRAVRDQNLLQNALGGWFPFLIATAFAYGIWAVISAGNGLDKTIPPEALSFLATRGLTPPSPAATLFDTGRDFMILISICMMAFVLRSYGSNLLLLRPAQIILCGYAVAGLIFFMALEKKDTVSAIVVFEKILLQNGLGGVLTATLFALLPLGALAFSRSGDRDSLVTGTGFVMGLALILCFFMPFTPAIGGYAALCAAGLFLASGHADLQKLDTASRVG
jgi:hypothetical protein